MKRIILGGSVLLLALVATLLAPTAVSTAGAQANTGCFPGTTYPPGGPEGEDVALVTANFQITNGAAATATIQIGGLNPFDTYCGFLFSTPVTLVERAADSNGRITYQLALPPGFALDAMHHIDIYREGGLVGSFSFCVARTGSVVPDVTRCPNGGTTTTTVAGGGTTTTVAGGATTTVPGATTTVVGGGGATSTTRAIAVLGSKSNTGGGSLAKTGADRILEIVRVGLVLLAVGAFARYLRRRRLQRHVA